MSTEAEPESLGRWSLDPRTMELRSSAACRRNHGRQPHEDPTYEQIVASIHPDDRERVRRAVRRAFEEGEDYEEQYRAILPSGEVRNILARGRLQQPPNGGAPRLAGTTLDVTGGASGRGEQTILEATGEGIYGLDASGRVTFVNPAAQRMAGREAGEMIGERMHEEVHHSRAGGSPYPARECPIHDTLTDGSVRYSEDEVFWRADGSSFPVSYTATPIFEDGEIAGAVVTFSDITESKRAGKAVRESEERLAAIFSQAAAGISEISPEGRFLLVNDELCRILGRTRQELLGMSVPEVTHPEDAAESLAAFESAVKTGEQTSLDKRYLRPDGRVVPANSTLTLLAGEWEGARTVLAVTVDLTERKRAEEALRESEERQGFLLRLSDRIRDLKSQEEIGEVCTRLLAEEMNLDRVYFVRFYPGEDRALIGPEYRSIDLEPVSGSYPFSAFPEAIRQIRDETPVYDDVANDSTLPEAEKQALLQLGFGAWIGAPIRTKEKDVDWALYAVTTEPHTWTDNEVSLVEETAERTWAAVERARAEEALGEAEQRYRTLFESMDEGYAVVEALADENGVYNDFLFLEVNPAFEKHTGVVEPVGRTGTELLGDPDPGWMRIYGRVAETGEPERVEQEEATLGRIFDLYAFRLGEAGSRRVAVLFTDITERKRVEAEREQARQRTAFLSEASRRLAESLDWEQTLLEIARLAVPRICDLCVVDTVDAPGEGSSVRRLAAAHHDPEKERLAWELEERYPISRDGRSAVAEVLRTKRPTLVTQVDDEWLARMSQDEGHRQILKGLDLGSITIVPLITHGRILGAMTLASGGSGRHYDEEDLALAEDLARRAAQSMDNARLYAEQSHAARTLQQSLLPPSLPEIPGMEAAARFKPATSAAGDASGGYNVGGDFYDVFQTPAGWAVVVGDVMGKGVEAAELTAMVRYTLRTAAMSGDSPSSVVSTLNAAMLNQRSDLRFCTLAYGLLNEAGDGEVRLKLCRGGHPPPLIVRSGGAVEEAGTRGLLVGVEPDPEWADIAIDLATDDAVVFYTDGLTEARNPEGRMFGARRLEELAASCCNLGADETADALERGVVEFQEGENSRDDVALLVIRAAGESGAG